MKNEQVCKKLELDIKELEDFHNDFSSAKKCYKQKIINSSCIDNELCRLINEIYFKDFDF